MLGTGGTSASKQTADGLRLGLTSEDILSHIFENYAGIVIERFGVGGLPETLMKTFYKEMSSWIARGKIVVMTTQVANEGSDMTIYEVGKKMKYTQFKERFYDTVNHDILFKGSSS